MSVVWMSCDFWTAANSMVTQLNSGEVRVTEETVDVNMSVADAKFFFDNPLTIDF